MDDQNVEKKLYDFSVTNQDTLFGNVYRMSCFEQQNGRTATHFMEIPDWNKGFSPLYVVSRENSARAVSHSDLGTSPECTEKFYRFTTTLRDKFELNISVSEDNKRVMHINGLAYGAEYSNNQDPKIVLRLNNQKSCLETKLGEKADRIGFPNYEIKWPLYFIGGSTVFGAAIFSSLEFFPSLPSSVDVILGGIFGLGFSYVSVGITRESTAIENFLKRKGFQKIFQPDFLTERFLKSFSDFDHYKTEEVSKRELRNYQKVYQRTIDRFNDLVDFPEFLARYEGLSVQCDANSEAEIFETFKKIRDLLSEA